MKKFDVVIIGAGSAGLSARREVAKMTDNYVVVDGGTLGTTCARVGCMPSKVLIQVAEDMHRCGKFTEQGLILSEMPSVDSSLVMRHVRKLRDRFVRAVTNDMEEWIGTKFINSHAKFIDEHTLQVGDEKIYGEKIIIAAGTKPAIPPVLKDFKEFLVSTDEFFELEELPESMAVIGLGIIGMELGQSLSRLGVKTIGIARRESIAGISDPKLKTYAMRKFSEELNLSFKGIQSVEKANNRLKIQTGDQHFEVDKVLLASGRQKNFDALNIAAAGFSGPLIDHNTDTMQSLLHSHIYVAGDITGENQVLHEASDEGKIAGYNCVNTLSAFKRRVNLVVAFSDPNIAFIGKTYQELVDENVDFEVGEVSFEGQGRSIVKLKETGLLRIYGERSSGKILGAELMAPDGEHLAHLISWGISSNLTVVEMLALPFYHPVVEEGLRTALRSLRDKIGGTLPPLEIPVM